MSDSPYSVTNAILQATAALNNATRVAERQQESIERLARGVEDGNAQHLTFSSRTTTALEESARVVAEQAKQIAILAAAVQSLVPQVAEAKSEAGRAADNSSTSFRHETDAPKHAQDTKDSGKEAVVVARRAWRDLLYAPGRGQAVAVAVLFIAAMTFLGYLAIKSNIRVAEMESSSPIPHVKQLKGP